MLLRLSTTASRSILVLLSLISAVFLGYYSVRNARAEHAVGLNTLAGYQRAVRLEPGSARNWYLLGRYWQYNMEDPDANRAITYYHRSLSFDPHSADAWLDLATAYDGEGDAAESRAAFLSARRAAPASADVAWRYGNFLLRQGEVETGFEEIHRAVLADPKRGAEAFSRCWRVDPDAERILQSVIPPSREAYVGILHDLADAHQIEPALAVWKHLVALHPKISLGEIRSFSNEMLRSGRVAELESVWQQAVSMMDNPPPPDPSGSVLWDGGFESGFNGDGLAWHVLKESHGVRADLDSSRKHSGNQSLRLSFYGKENVNYAEACHYAIVRPGVAYRLSAWVMTKNLTSSEGIRLRLRFTEKSSSKISETSDLRGTEPWTNLSLSWIAPSGSQVVQVCIVRNADDGMNGDIEGSAWVDDVSLVPSGESAHP